MQDRQKLLNAILEFSYRERHDPPFTLASGTTSPYYFDLKQTLFRPEFLKLAASALIDEMNKAESMPDYLAGLTMGADPLIYACCLSAVNLGMHILPLIVRKVAKDHGTGKKIEGIISQVQPSSRISLIDDVITTGGSTLKALDAVEAAGWKADTAYCLVDRMEGGAQALHKRGVDLKPVFTLEDFRQK